MSKVWTTTVNLTESDFQDEIYRCVFNGESFTWTFPIEPDEHGISVGAIEINFISEEDDYGS